MEELLNHYIAILAVASIYSITARGGPATSSSSKLLDFRSLISSVLQCPDVSVFHPSSYTKLELMSSAANAFYRQSDRTPKAGRTKV